MSNGSFSPFQLGRLVKFQQVGPEFVPVILDETTGELRQVVWAPQPGSQELFLEAMEIEVLYEGTRGPGKTDALLMDFASEVGKGWGAEWRGVLFRQTHPQLRDVIEKSKKWFKRMYPEAFYNEIKAFWEFPAGERLYFSHFNTPSQYSDYHGHAYPWIGWEELTTWPDPNCFKVMFACSRSTIKGMPRKVRATTNPYGVGHNWVRQRYQLYGNCPDDHLWPVIVGSRDENGNLEPSRRAIHGTLTENKLLLYTDPGYIDRIRAAARNESELRAWMDGDWSITAGGMFDDIWFEFRDSIVVPDFEVPQGWSISRAYDHGSSKPFSIGWFAESDGTDLRFPDGSVRSTVPGDLFLVQEWYGWRGQPNEGSRLLAPDIARGILEREVKWGWRHPTGDWSRITPGPADTSIFDDINGVNVAADFAKPILVGNHTFRKGVVWEKADKGPGSREQGWEQMRKRMKATKRPDGGVREIAGLFICKAALQWLRTVPTLPRDEKKIDDVDTEAEDHAGDMTRYRLRWNVRRAKQRTPHGGQFRKR